MKTTRSLASLTAACLTLTAAAEPAAVSDAWTLEAISANARLTADWMTANPKKHNLRDWTYGSFYAGIAALGLSDPSLPYLDQIRTLGQETQWTFLPRTYHADDHCIGQSWLEVAAFDNNPAIAEHIRQTYDYILTNPYTGSMDFTQKNALNRWSWCDALFMSPTVLVKLAGFTGETKYLTFMDQEFKATYDLLYSKEHQLFFRDSTYLDKKAKNGKPVFWCRGNGWVFGALPIILRDLPSDWPTYPFYLKLYQEMAEGVKRAQQPDGSWHPSLLDPEDPDLPEMSGTSFFTYGLLWGINNGILDRAAYLPCVEKSWKAIASHINAEGRLGSVQPIGAAPASYTDDSCEVYAVGAYLCAAVELRKQVIENAHPERKTVDVANPLNRYRAADTIDLDWPALGLKSENLRVFDVRNGAVIPHQLFDSDGDGTPDRLLFTTYTLAKQRRTFWIFNDAAVPAAPTAAICFSRYAPDRLDDVLWENDRTAGRIYGPIIMKPAPIGQGLVSSGVDIWNKRVRYPIVDKWIKQGHYHDDHGEGMDNFSVGPTRGVGGLGVFNAGTCYVSQNWAKQKHLADGPVRTAFEVTYAPWDCGNGVTVAETRRMSLDAGSHLVRFESRFTLTGTAALEAGPGLSLSAKHLHTGTVTARPAQGWLTNYENEQPKKGSIATALVLAAGATLRGDAEENVYLLTTLASDKPLVWYAGGAWSGAGDFTTPSYWNDYVDTFAEALRSPLSVTVK